MSISDEEIVATIKNVISKGYLIVATECGIAQGYVRKEEREYCFFTQDRTLHPFLTSNSIVHLKFPKTKHPPTTQSLIYL